MAKSRDNFQSQLDRNAKEFQKLLAEQLPGIRAAAEITRKNVRHLKHWVAHLEELEFPMLFSYYLPDPDEEGQLTQVPSKVEKKCKAACVRVIKKEIREREIKLKGFEDYLAKIREKYPTL